MDSRHGDEEKQWAHVKKSEDGAGMRIEKQKEKSCISESDCARPTSYKPGELFHDPNLNISSVDNGKIIRYLSCLSHFLNDVPLDFI